MSGARSWRFTRLDLAAVIAGIAFLAFLFLIVFPKAVAKSKRIQCINNLKSIGLGYRIFATDNGDRFPWETTNQPPFTLVTPDDVVLYYLSASNELSAPHLLICPADKR